MERGLSGSSGWSCESRHVDERTQDENLDPATLVDIRGSILSDAGSIPAISTIGRGFPSPVLFLTDQALQISPLREVQSNGMIGSLAESLQYHRIHTGIQRGPGDYLLEQIG